MQNTHETCDLETLPWNDNIEWAGIHDSLSHNSPVEGVGFQVSYNFTNVFEKLLEMDNVLVYLTKFPRKLHENEEILPGWGRPSRPLGSANAIDP